MSIRSAVTAGIMVASAARPLHAQTPLDSALLSAESRGFHGVVLVAHGGQTVLLKGYGFANHATQARFSPSTLVQIGSNVKDFTRLAVFQLIEAGRLRLDDTLGKFVPGLPEDRRRITVEQLMAHRAGFPLGAGGGDQRALTRADLVNAIATVPLGSPPGTATRYSNMGYATLALIIEQVSGEAFDRYVAEHVLTPAGMRETGSHLAHFDPARVAHGYTRGNEDAGSVLDLPHDETGHLYQLRGNGGYVSTAQDMMRFYHAIPSLLRDEEHRRAVFDPDAQEVLAGSDLTCFFAFANFPAEGYQVIVGSNHADYNGQRLLDEIMPVLGIRTGPRRMAATPGGAPSGTATLPDTGPGHVVAAYIEAFNSGDTAAMRRFFDEHGANDAGAPTTEVRLQRYQQMLGNLGRITVHSVTVTSDGIVVGSVTSNGDPVSLTFVVDTAAPYRLHGVRVEVG